MANQGSLLPKICECFETERVYYTRHAKVEMETEEYGQIFDFEVQEAIASGEIIEEYLGDKPYPCVLIFGQTKEKRPLHVVCAYSDEEHLAVVVTTYQPDPDLWIDMKRRKRS